MSNSVLQAYSNTGTSAKYSDKQRCLHIRQIFNSHWTSMNIELELSCPYWFSAWQRYVPLSSGRTEGKVWGWLGPQSRGWLFLNQVYSAAGLASLLQLRVTERPSFISPEGLRVTEGVFGASVINTKDQYSSWSYETVFSSHRNTRMISKSLQACNNTWIPALHFKDQI